MTYDVLGHLSTEVDSSFSLRRLYWNAFGELDHVLDGKVQTTTWFRDQLGRVTNIAYPGAVATFTWDTQRPGLLTSALAPNGTVDSYEYDTFGRTKFAHKSVQSVSGFDDYVLQYVWGIGDRLDEVRYPAVDGEPSMSVAYRYDEAGHLRAAINPVGGAVHWLAREANARTQVNSERYDNGVTTTRDWNELRGWIDAISTTGAGSLQELEYHWKPSGELDKRTAGPATGNQEETFAYDELHRLTTATVRRNGGTPLQKTTGYDRTGNITSKTSIGTYVYNSGGRLQSINGGNVGHDNNGNVISEGGRSFAYTPFDKISSVTKAAITTNFFYDADQQRVLRSHPSEGDTVSVDEFYEREIAPGGATQRITYRVVANGRVVTEIVRTPGAPWNTKSYGMHDDHLGSTNVVSDAAGAPAWGVGYDAWGGARLADNWQTYNDAPLSSIAVGFTGHRAKLDTGVIDMRGRTYDPRLGRFLQVDPIVADPSDGQSWNRYSYVGNRPLVFTDPTGWRPDHGDINFSHDFDDEDGTQGRSIRVPDQDYAAVPYRDPGFETWGLGPDSHVGGTQSTIRISREFYRDNAFALNYLWRSQSEARDAAAAASMASQNNRKNPFAGILAFSRALDVATEATLEYGSWVPVIAAIDTGKSAMDAIAAGDEDELIGIAANAVVGRLLPGSKLTKRGGPVVGGGATLDKLTSGEARRIQNAANRSGAEIAVVGSRVNPNKALHAGSDYDYVVNVNSKTRNNLSRSLPGAKNVREGTPGLVDFFRGDVNTSLPHVIFSPQR